MIVAMIAVRMMQVPVDQVVARRMQTAAHGKLAAGARRSKPQPHRMILGAPAAGA
jgi:hypothetical protein